jgi:hypothetical protein
MVINKKQMSLCFLENIECISDKEFQKRVWIQGAGPECHDFDEAVNFFSAEGDHILEHYQDYGLSRRQYEILKKFRDKFKVFYHEKDWPPEFIDTPEWAEIMDLAKEVLKTFNYPAVNTQRYLIDSILLIKGQAKLDDAEGAITGYHSIVELLKHQAFVFCFDQKELGLAEINPDMDLHPMIACEEDRAVEIMSEERIKEFLRDTIKILKERAREAKKAADNPKAHQSAEFNAAYLRAYYKVISTMKSWAPVYGIDLKEINLDDIDPERDLLVSKST